MGDAQWLTANGQQFLAIYTEAQTPNPLGGVILLHGMGAHPDWPAVISPLRRELPESGWSTLSIQMPILSNQAKIKDYLAIFEDVAPRINAAMTFLHARGIANVALVGHSLGAAMGADYLAKHNSGGDIRAFVGIGMGGYKPPDVPLNTPSSLAKIAIPVLDLYGSLDLDAIKNSVRDRAKAAQKANNKLYRQTEILGADHFFTGMDKLLVNHVRSWLKKFASSVKFTR